MLILYCEIQRRLFMKFGIDLGGSHVAIGLVDENSEIIEKRTYYMNDRRNVSLEDYIVSSIDSRN